MAEKDLSYYLALPYAVEIRELSEDEGGGFLASIPLLGRASVVADGNSVDEAMKNLTVVKRNVIEHWLRCGESIPEPVSEDEYSGKFVVRIPRYLHKYYADFARDNDMSLNTAILSALERNAREERVCEVVEERLAHYIGPVRDRLDRLLSVRRIELKEDLGKNIVGKIDWAA